MNGQIEAGNAREAGDAGIVRNAARAEQMEVHGRYAAVCCAPSDENRSVYIQLRDRIEAKPRWLPRWIHELRMTVDRARLAAIPLEPKWTDAFDNLVTTVGKNNMLDNHLSGSAYTAAWYMGLISSVSYSAVAAADTMASHAGWFEAGNANQPTYSQANRPTTAWNAAATANKSLSAALVFSITGNGTAKGAFLTSNLTKDGTLGTLFSAGLFTGGDKVLQNGDTLNVSYTASV